MEEIGECRSKEGWGIVSAREMLNWIISILLLTIFTCRTFLFGLVFYRRLLKQVIVRFCSDSPNWKVESLLKRIICRIKWYNPNGFVGVFINIYYCIGIKFLLIRDSLIKCVSFTECYDFQNKSVKLGFFHVLRWPVPRAKAVIKQLTFMECWLTLSEDLCLCSFYYRSSTVIGC